MRIERIAIRGLASLRDAQPAIDLTGPVYGDAGLIAVTGPTGAGKSTIFDAVCLALYDATPRLHGRGADPRELLSRGAATARVEVTIRLDDDNRILASWSVNRARERLDGALQAAQLEIRDPGSDRVLAAGKQRVQALVQERIGLSFDQFRSVAMLSQGDFARFIQAEAKDKAELLEKLTGTGLYAELSRQAHQRHARLRDDILRREAALGAMALLGEAEIAARRADLEQVQAGLGALRAEAAGLERQQAWWSSQAELAARIVATAADLAEAVRAQAALAGETARLELARRAQGCAATLAAAAAARTTEQQRRTAADRARADLPAALAAEQRAQERLIGSIGRVVAVHEAAASRRESHRAWQAITPAAVQRLQALVHSIGIAAREQLRHEADMRAAEQQREAAVAAQATGAAKLQAATTRAAEAKEALTVRNAALKQAASQGSPSQLSRRAGQTEQAIGLARVHAQAATELARLQQELDDLERTVAEDGQQAEQAAAALGEAQQARDEQQRARDHLVKIAKVEEFRDLLEDGKPCPLCGSVEHRGRPPKAGVLAKAEAQLAKLATLVEQIAKRQQEQAKQHQLHATAAARQRALLTERQRQADERRAEWAVLRQQLADLPEDPALAEGLEQRLAGLQERIAAIATAQEQRDAAQEAATRADEELARLTQQDEQHRTAIATAGKGVDLAQRGIAAQQGQGAAAWEQLLAGTTALAAELREPAPARDEAEAYVAALPGRAADWAAIVVQARSAAELHERALGLLGKLPAGTTVPPAAAPARSDEAVIDRLKSELRQDADAFERACQAGRDARTAVTQTASELQRADEALQAASERLQEDLRRAQFADEAAARAALLAPEQLAASEARLREAARRHDQCLALHAAAEQAAARHQATAGAAGADPAAEDAAAGGRRSERLAAIAAESMRLDELRATVLAELKADQQRRREHAAAFAELEGLRTAIRPWADLDALIGHSNGDVFRQVAQGLVLDQLLTLANRRLAAIAPRYALTRSGQGGDPLSLALTVIDHDQADERRPVATLSGGETFLASLALALALADLKRGRLRLGTLFIDEGFGSLDLDTLDLAMGVLERLQAEQGTQILLISHVGLMQDRIRHQIRVQPLGAGVSRVRLQTPEGAWSTEFPSAAAPAAPAAEGASPADAQAVLERVAAHGGPLGTRKLRSELGWEAPRLAAVIELLLAEGRLVRPAGSKSVALP